ncbi:MAG: hypothetical protein KDI01_04610 [Halioglobus sp.]|nr:hypothetical protein [Halioglobus sp.]
MLDQGQVATINIGARDAKHLQDNLQVFEFGLDADDLKKLNAVLAERTGPAGDVYGIDREEDRDALEEVKTEYYDVEGGRLVKKTRKPVVLKGESAYGHHLHQQ